MTIRRALATAAVACALAGAPCSVAPLTAAYASPGAPTPAPSGPTVTVAPTRPTFQLGEPVELAGRVTDATGLPIADAPVIVTIDHDSEGALTATTDASGEWRLTVQPRPGWGAGLVDVNAVFVSGPDAPSAQQRGTFSLTIPGAPVALHVDPVAGPVSQGREVELSGRLVLADGRPVARQSVYVVADPSGDAAAFASTDEQGAWRTRFTVPDLAGTFDGAFPAYTVKVNFDGDTGVGYDGGLALAPASAPVGLTLTGPPITRPTPAVSTAPPPAAAAAGVGQRDAPPMPRPTAGARAAYVQMPSATSPGILLLGAGAGLTVMGAAMLSHARRLRS
ncbi:carboxypeptidase-like regulatory domain-containing protein [Mariniluteicoccus flavus]